MRLVCLSAVLTLLPATVLAQTTQPELPPPPPASGEPSLPPPPPVVQSAVSPSQGQIVQGYGQWGAPAAPTVWRPMYVPTRPVRYHDGDPVPPGARITTTNDRGLIVAGSLTLGIPWVVSALIGSLALGNPPYSDSERALGWLMAPVIGPIVTLALLDDFSGFAGSQLVLDAVTQAAGLTMLIVGLAADRKWLVFDGPTPAGMRLGFAPSAAGHPGLSVGLTL